MNNLKNELYNMKDFINWYNSPIQLNCININNEILSVKNMDYIYPQGINNVLKFLYLCKLTNSNFKINMNPLFSNKKWYYLI